MVRTWVDINASCLMIIGIDLSEKMDCIYTNWSYFERSDDREGLSLFGQISSNEFINFDIVDFGGTGQDVIMDNKYMKFRILKKNLKCSYSKSG
jgi:hypothetical protein